VRRALLPRTARHSPARSGLFSGVTGAADKLRANVLDAADAATGTGAYDTRPGAGIGAGANPMRGTGVTGGEAANVAAAQRGQAVAERDTTTGAAGAHTGAGAGLAAGAQSTGPAVAMGAPAGPGMLGGSAL
jgi:hypothetical protein